jgi:hypothetical protein
MEMLPNGKVLLVGSDSAPNTVLYRLDNKSFDTQPVDFTFTDEPNVSNNSLVTSNMITISGITAGINVPVTIENGEYAINGNTTYQNGIGFVSLNDQINVRHTSSASNSTATDTTLYVGGILPTNSQIVLNPKSDIYSSTTAASGATDTVPDAFSFIDKIDIAASSLISSNEITISGINTASPISIAGGEYSINGAAFTNASSIINNTDAVIVRLSSSILPTTSTNTVLTIGTVSATFTVTTSASSSTSGPAPSIAVSSGSGGGGGNSLNAYFSLLFPILIIVIRRYLRSRNGAGGIIF